MALIFTTKGELDESLLEKKEGSLDNEHEITNWIEYWHEGELVHRSVHVTLKKNVFSDGVAAMLA
jgi:hypothetical protein